MFEIDLPQDHALLKLTLYTLFPTPHAAHECEKTKSRYVVKCGLLQFRNMMSRSEYNFYLAHCFLSNPDNMRVPFFYSYRIRDRKLDRRYELPELTDQTRSPEPLIMMRTVKECDKDRVGSRE